MTEEQLMTMLVTVKGQLQTIMEALANVENLQDEILTMLPALKTQVDLTGVALTALADEFVPLGRSLNGKRHVTVHAG